MPLGFLRVYGSNKDKVILSNKIYFFGYSDFISLIPQR